MTAAPTNRERGLYGLLLAALLAAWACAGTARPPGGEPELQQVTITSWVTPTEFRFQPTELHLRANIPVRLTFDNRLRPGSAGGALAHDFTIDSSRGPGLLARLVGYRVHIPVAANSIAVGEFLLPVGTYEFYCSVDRHRLDGMVGTVVVSNGERAS